MALPPSTEPLEEWLPTCPELVGKGFKYHISDSYNRTITHISIDYVYYTSEISCLAEGCKICPLRYMEGHPLSYFLECIKNGEIRWI